MIYHRYLQYANQTLEWVDTDSFEGWNTNYNKNRSQLEEAGWIDQDPIEYRFNSAGFRGQEFDANTKFVGAGCSHTFGLGLHAYQTWVGQLEKKIDKPITNLGIGGASMDTVYRILDSMLGYLRPDVLFLFAPNSYRVEFCIEDNKIWEVFNVHTNNNIHLKNYFINDCNSAINFQKNLQAIKHLCLSKDITLYYLTADHNFEADHCARDLLHSGPRVHQNIAQQFYSLLNH